MLRGERRMHGIRLFQGAVGRTQNQRVRIGTASRFPGRPAGSWPADDAQQQFFDFAAVRTSSASRTAKRSRARSTVPAATGDRHGSAAPSDGANSGSVRAAEAAGSSAGDAVPEEPPGLRAAGSFSGNFRRAQFLCGVYTKSRLTTLPYAVDLL